jgi:putative transposase
MATSTPTDTRHRCPPEVIRHAVWLFCRLRLSDRDAEERLRTRGTVGTRVKVIAVRAFCPSSLLLGPPGAGTSILAR